MRIATGAAVSCSKVLLYRECGWDPLCLRRKNPTLIQMFKMYHKMIPTYMAALIPPSVAFSFDYPLRNSRNIKNIFCPFTYS